MQVGGLPRGLCVNFGVYYNRRWVIVTAGVGVNCGSVLCLRCILTAGMRVSLVVEQCYYGWVVYARVKHFHRGKWGRGLLLRASSITAGQDGDCDRGLEHFNCG